MRRTYLVLGWAIVLFGGVHMFAATRVFSGVTAHALWFFSGGIAMSLTGALNLLNHSYGAAAPGLRRVCVAANLVMTAFGVAAGIVDKASAAALVIVLGLEGSVTLLSMLRGSLAPSVYNARQ